MPKKRFLRRVSGAVVLLASATAFVLPAVAATVNGTLTLTPELGQRAEAEAQKRVGSLKQYYWRVSNEAVPTVSATVDPARDLAVVIERADGQATAPAGATKLVKLRGARLVPSVIVVTPHTEVRFQNDDAIVYELECPENAAMANGQVIPPGRAVMFRFDEEGVFTITDRRVPHLLGYVVVVGSALSLNPRPGAQPGEAAFSIPDVPPGQYVVKVFHAGEWVAQQPLEVTEAEEVGVQIRVPSDGQQHEGAGGESPEQEEQ